MKNPFSGLFRARDKPQDSVSTAPVFYFGTSGSGKSVTVQSAIQLSTVYACVRVSIGANAIAANHKIADAVFENQMVRALLDDDGSGTYDIGGLAEAMKKSIEQYGSFPVHVPAIPLISPTELTLKLTAEDVAAMRSRIESAV